MLTLDHRRHKAIAPPMHGANIPLRPSIVMAAYVVAIIDIQNAERYENEYVRGVRPLMAKYGGRSLMASDTPDIKEGAWPPGRLIVIEFPDKAAAEAWYADPEYRPLLRLRSSISKSLLAIAEGR